MIAWVAAAGVVLLYNFVARRRGRAYACARVRALSPVRKTAAVVGYGWLGHHLFLRRNRG